MISLTHLGLAVVFVFAVLVGALFAVMSIITKSWPDRLPLFLFAAASFGVAILCGSYL